MLNLFRSVILLVGVFAITSCCENTPPISHGPNDFIQVLWSSSLHKNLPTSNSIIRANLVFEDLAIVATTDGIDNRYISAVHLSTGKEKWFWNNIYQAPTEYFDISYAYQANNLLTYQVGSRSYCINLTTGATQWRIRRNGCIGNDGFCSFRSEISGLGNIYYTLGPALDTLQQFECQIGYKGNIQSGEIAPFLIPAFSGAYLGPNNFLGALNHIVPFVDINGDTLIVVDYAEATEGNPNYLVSSYLGLFNDTKNSWVYERKLLTQPKWNSSVFHTPIIYEDLILIQVGQGIVCHDLSTGVRVWAREDFTQDFLFSGMIVENGVVYANNEDGFLYALNSRNGQVIWKEETAGTSSPLRYLNGVIYLSGGSTSRIHAIDTETGETVWLLDPVKYDDGSDDFKPDLYVVPGENGEKGKVIFQTHNTAYCVEAYR